MTTSRRRAGLGSLRPAADLFGDVVTAYVDVSRTTQDATHEVETRISNLTRDLLDGGADRATVDAVAARLREPTGQGGEVCRVLVAHDGRLVADVTMTGTVVDRHGVGPVARLGELARLTADGVSYVLAVVDHTGADITVADTFGVVEQDLLSEGDHDVLHKVRGGGWSQRRYQSRVEDSIERNADTVARDLDALVREVDPDVVLLAGEPKSTSRIREHVAGHVSERLEVLEHGSRAEGASDELVDEEIAGAVRRCRARRTDEVLDRLGAAGSPSAVGVGDVVEALRRGEVETLVLLDGALDDREGYVGDDPLLLGTHAEDLRGLGVEEPVAERLEDALVRAAIGQDADLLPLHAPVATLPDGVGAVLRFSSRPDTRSDREDQ
jgi:hypothetical protein